MCRPDDGPDVLKCARAARTADRAAGSGFRAERHNHSVFGTVEQTDGYCP